MNQLVELYEKQELEAHKFADAFPLIEGAEFDELVQSIRDNGLMRPLIVFNGLLLDGRNRYRALKALGLPIAKADVAEFTGSEDEARELVRLENVTRRHMTPTQRAMSIIRLDGDKTASEKLAKQHGLSATAMKKARTVSRSAAPHILDMVEAGTVTMLDAQRVSYLPKKEQRKLKTPEKVAERAATMPNSRYADVTEKGFTRTRINTAFGTIHRMTQIDVNVIVRRLDEDDRQTLRGLLPEFGAFMLRLAEALQVQADPDFREVDEPDHAQSA